MEYVQVLGRAVAMFAFTLVVFRIVGKRAVSELSAFDMVLVIASGTLIATPVVDLTVNVWYSVVGIAALGALDVLVAYLALRSNTLERLVEGSPIKLVENGKVIPGGMARARLTTANLVEELRKKGYRAVADVELAYMEPVGSFSVIAKREVQPITPRALGTKASTTLIDDGQANLYNLQQVGLTQEQLSEQVKRHGASNISAVERATQTPDGHLHVVLKQSDREKSSRL